MIIMLCVRSRQLNNYLWDKGCIPMFETQAAAYYKINGDLQMLLENYYIRYYCIPNRL